MRSKTEQEGNNKKEIQKKGGEIEKEAEKQGKEEKRKSK
jgi:hypothetical protein